MCACKALWLEMYQSLEVGDWAVFGWFCSIRCSSYSFASQ